MNEDGAEVLYRLRIDEPAVNVGAAVIFSTPGSLVHPWMLGSPDENDVQGYAGTPVNVNNLTLDFPLDIGAAATIFPRSKAYYVAVDSGRDQFTGRSLGGEYLLRAWVNDVQPPLLGLITTRVSAGRPTIALRVLDLGAGVDPVLARDRLRPGARSVRRRTTRSPASRSSRCRARRPRCVRASACSQLPPLTSRKSKNVDSVGDALLPNTAFASGNITVVNRPTITWVTPEPSECAPAQAQLLVLASSTAVVRSVRFLDGRKPIATVRRGVSGLYSVAWRRGGAAKGKHTLRAIVTDAQGRKAESQRVVRVCR